MTEIDRFIYRIKVILHDEQSRAVRGRTGARISCERQFYAAPLDATAFFADLGNGGEVNMQRQEKNEQQCRDTYGAAKNVRFGGQRREHVKNLAQSIYRCQRGLKLARIIGHVPDAAKSAGLSPRISSLVILLQRPGAAAEAKP